MFGQITNWIARSGNSLFTRSTLAAAGSAGSLTPKMISYSG
jgi:hypothetical protein